MSSSFTAVPDIPPCDHNSDKNSETGAKNIFLYCTDKIQIRMHNFLDVFRID
jgi:hypothetical protein